SCTKEGGGGVMDNQRTFASMAWSAKGKVTRRECFLAEMDAVLPCLRLLALIEPHHPKAGNGGQNYGPGLARRYGASDAAFLKVSIKIHEAIAAPFETTDTEVNHGKAR